MENKDLKIHDESGDKRYFTIIPNYILNHSTIWDREVYIQMKKIAGENGTCWTSRNTLARKCGISLDRLKKSIQYLVEHRWIEKVGKKKVKTAGGEQEVNEYKICDLWEMNNNFYNNKGGSSEILPLTQRGVVKHPKGGSSNDYKEEPINNNHIPDFYKKNQISEKITEKDIDELGIPIDRPAPKVKMSPEGKAFLTSLAFVWRDMVSGHLSIPGDEVVLSGIYYPLKQCWVKNKFSKDQFKDLFKHFLNDREIRPENKMAFDLCLSQKYVSKYKLFQKNKPKLDCVVSSMIKL